MDDNADCFDTMEDIMVFISDKLIKGNDVEEAVDADEDEVDNGNEVDEDIGERSDDWLKEERTLDAFKSKFCCIQLSTLFCFEIITAKFRKIDINNYL